jgi:uncharacterized membrane protein YdjX (TVP38/TMEM64 family)
MKFTKKQAVWCCILIAIAAILIALYYIGKGEGWFKLFESNEKVREYVASFGALAPLAFFLLQFFQVIVSPIPGNVTTIAGGMLFGFFPAFLISTGAIFLGSICAFLLGKLFGRPLVEKIAGKTVIDKYMMTVSSRQKIVLIIMFLMPFFPDDILCLIAGLSAMSVAQFALIVILTRPWGLLFSAMLGSGFIKMPEWGWITLICGAIVLFILSIKYAPIIEERVKHWLERTFLRKEHHDN